MNKGGQPIVAPQPIVQSKDSSADIKKLQDQINDLKKEMIVKVNSGDFESYKRDLKVNDIDRINRIIEELR